MKDAEEDSTRTVSPPAAVGNAPVGASHPAPGQQLAGRYTVLELLGEGGMGLVLAAYDSRLDRRVALKLPRSHLASGEQEQRRLLREAQAMARLSHPHVVQVYDAGLLEDGRLFLSMQFVEGQNLYQWLHQRPRTWRQVLEAFLAAGRGLAAAHATGLVHRDFKPENVLVGRDGGVRVTDFGVVCAGSGTRPSGPVPLVPTPPHTWNEQLTSAGAVVGTPRYLAPEVLAGRPADARSDLFSWCVALHEALFHQSPFPGATVEERARAMLAGPAAPPARSEVPGWVVRALQQGLALDPRERPASLLELVAALEKDPAVRCGARARAAAMGLAFAAAGALATWGWGYTRQPRCARMEQQLAGVWDEAVRLRVRQALRGTGLPYAQDTASRVEAALEGYASHWVRLRTEVCQANEAPAGSPQGLAALQESCLERRRSQVRALTELLARGADPEVLPRAVQAVDALPPVQDCADARLLTAAVPPPERPQVRAQVEALLPRADRLEALHAAGKYKEGLEVGEALLREVEPLHYAPLHARVLHLLALHKQGAGEASAAEALVRQAIPLAARGRDDLLAARAWNLLLLLVGHTQGRPQEALGWVLSVEHAVARAGDEGLRSTSLNNLGLVLEDVGRLEEAREHYARALALKQRQLGPEHPTTLTSLANLGTVLGRLGRTGEALTYLQQAQALREKVLGPEHPSNAISLTNLAYLLDTLGQPEQARALFERALDLRRKVLGPEHPRTALSLLALGRLLREQGQLAQAREHHERALASLEKAPGPESLDAAYAHSALGFTLLAQGEWEQARHHLERALTLLERHQGLQSPVRGEVLEGLAEYLLARGQPTQAVARLEQALALASADRRPVVLLQLARALWAAGPRRARARALATEALQHWQRLGHRTRQAEVQDWLDSHVLPAAPGQARARP
ncbi:MAG TPA: serine/threonine-protein kinase [Archangium sp.]|uniref:serine/threonine-protein kinase n=1 Tax=Archangium sp. TaxID=1872627 RepID=UPI002E30DCD3|nr:serine/threonine-protein kinase [Archangium sp.]HEX5746790.1 serine/threonine-protein kinase [Archangium sp.]